MSRPSRIRIPTHLLFGFVGVLLLVFGAMLYIYTHATTLTYLWQIATRQTKPLCKNCNVIVVSLDTLSALHLPCYGYTRNTAPNLCTFAKNHIWFPNSYAQSYFTLPSHASIFTSLYPSTHGMLQTPVDTLAPSHTTLAETLQRGGYSTLYFGPSDNEYIPLDKGLERGFDYIDTEYSYDKADGLDNWYRGIDMLKENNRQGKPTFLFLHTYYTHPPYLPGTRDLHFTNDNVPEFPVTQQELDTFTPDLVRYLEGFFRQNGLDREVNSSTKRMYEQFLRTSDFETAVKLYARLEKEDCSDFCWPVLYYYYQYNKNDPKKVAYMKALYDELILQLDAELKTFFATVAPMLTNDTILIVTADHGEEFMEHGQLFHASLYNEVLRVPLIFSIPRVSAKTVRLPTQGIDIYPTILRLVGMQPVSQIEGRDLTATVLGLPNVQQDRPIISELYNMTFVPAEHREVPLIQKAVMNSRWKLYVKDINTPNASNVELYDAKKDITDSKNVASKYPKIVTSLLIKLKQFASTHPVTYPKPSQKTPEMIKEEILKQRYFHY